MLIQDYTKRKVSISMAFILVAVFGIISFFELPIELFPPFEQAVFQVKVTYPVNNYKIVEQSVSKPIERQLTSLEGVLYTETQSFPNYSLINVYLNWQADVTGILLQAREKLDAIRLPDLADRPLLIKSDPSRFPVFSYLIKGKSVEELSKLVETHLSREFDQIEGIAEAQFIGTRERRVVIVPIDKKLNSYGISYAQLLNQLQSLPQTQSGAIIRDGFREWSLRIEDYIQTSDDLSNLVVFKNANRLIYLKDVCDIRYDYQNNNQFVLHASEDAILVNLIKESNANIIESAESVYEEIEKLKKFYPELEFTKVFDGADSISSNVTQLMWALLIGGILSFAILIFFYKSIRIPMYLAIVIPVSTLGTFVGCWALGVSFNIISLGGLGLGIGMLIDNGIIISDYVRQRFKQGLHYAVHDSIKVLWIPMLTSTLTSLAVFLPLLGVGDMTSVLFKQQAITISLSLAWAYISSITLLPLLILTFPPNFAKEDKKKSYRWTLLALKNPKRAISIVIFLILFFPFCIFMMNKSLMPNSKTEKIIAAYKVPSLTNRDSLKISAEAINKELNANGFIPYLYLENSKEFSADRFLEISIPIKSLDDIKVIESIFQKNIQGNWEIKFEKALMRQLVDERQDYESIIINTPNLEDKSRLKQLLEPYPKLETIGMQQQLFISLELNREKLLAYNIPVNQFSSYIEIKLKGSQVGEIKSFNRTDKIQFISNVDERYQFQSLLKSKYLYNGNFYPLENFVKWKIIDLPLWSLSINQHESVIIRQSIYDKNTNFDDLRMLLTENNFLSNNDIVSFRLLETNKQLVLSLIFSFILILFILAVQFESMRHPLLIVTIVPMSFSGSLLALWIFGESLNIISLSGLVILMGIVINDSILKIDAIQQYRLQGVSLLKAILKGSHQRLKSIILTSLTTVIAAAPLLFGSSGVELRRPLAIVMIAGMIFSTYLTIQIIPLLYYSFIKKESSND